MLKFTYMSIENPFGNKAIPEITEVDTGVLNRVLTELGASPLTEGMGSGIMPAEMYVGEPTHPVHNEPRLPSSPGQEDKNIAPGVTYPTPPPRTM